jgi:hypothetical protein
VISINYKQHLAKIFHPLRPSWEYFSVAFFLAAIILATISLGNLPLIDWDERVRALVSIEIYRTNNWLYPGRYSYFTKAVVNSTLFFVRSANLSNFALTQ